MWKKQLVMDTSAFGGLPLYCIVALILLLTKGQALFWRFITPLIVGWLVVLLVRTLYFKKRPINLKPRSYLQRIDYGSFPSVHAMRSVLLAVLLAGVFDTLLISTIFALVALGVLFMRVVMHVHDPVDVTAGGILGLILGLLANTYL